MGRTFNDTKSGFDRSGSQSDFSYEDEPNMGEIPDMEAVLGRFGIRHDSLEYMGMNGGGEGMIHCKIHLI